MEHYLSNVIPAHSKHQDLLCCFHNISEVIDFFIVSLLWLILNAFFWFMLVLGVFWTVHNLLETYFYHRYLITM